MPHARDAGGPVRRRADARRNRERIVAAAHLAFIRHGITVPMEEIARAAGVGVGTLYRHFGNREALLRAVVTNGAANVLAVARAETDHDDDPWDVLCRFVRRCVELRLGVTISALRPRFADAIREIPEIAAVRDTLLEAMEPLVAAAQERGAMRTDVGVGDVMILLGMLVRHEAEVPAERGRVVLRQVEIVLDGLRADAAGGRSPLPGRPMDAAALADLDPAGRSRP